MKIIAITQARVGSTRLPGKVLMNIEGNTLLQIHLRRILQSKLLDKLIVATTTEPGAANICDIATECGAGTYQGSMSNVLDRYYQAAKTECPDYVVRITSDCPLIDATIIDDVVKFTIDNHLDYASNNMLSTFPDGMDVEVFTFNALERAWHEAILSSDKEHVTPYIWRNSNFKGGHLFRSDNVQSDAGFESLRLTVDEAVDFELIEILIRALGPDASWKTYAEYVMVHPHLKCINQHITPNEGYLKSLKENLTN